MYKSAVNTIKYIRHYILFLIYCNIYLTYITTIHLGTTYPYGGCWLLLSRRGSFTICALKKNKPKLYFKLLFSLLGYDFFDQVSIFQWILWEDLLAWIFLLNIWSSPKYIPSELETSPMKQSKTYQLVTGFKWCNSWNVPYRNKDTQQFLWYNGERVRIFYPNMTQVHILLNKVPYAVKCNKLGVNPYSNRQSLNFCFQKYKHSNSHPIFHCPLDTHMIGCEL